jgi:hypothetical protein
MSKPWRNRQMCRSALTKLGTASSEDGFAILDGPDGVAITMTAFAAETTGLPSATAVAQMKIACGRLKRKWQA